MSLQQADLTDSQIKGVTTSKGKLLKFEDAKQVTRGHGIATKIMLYALGKTVGCCFKACVSTETRAAT